MILILLKVQLLNKELNIRVCMFIEIIIFDDVNILLTLRNICGHFILYSKLFNYRFV